MLLAVAKLMVLLPLSFLVVIALVLPPATHRVAEGFISDALADTGIEEKLFLLFTSRVSDGRHQVLVKSIVVCSVLEQKLNHLVFGSLLVGVLVVCSMVAGQMEWRVVIFTEAHIDFRPILFQQDLCYLKLAVLDGYDEGRVAVLVFLVHLLGCIILLSFSVVTFSETGDVAVLDVVEQEALIRGESCLIT